jgi:hypothetical protein
MACQSSITFFLRHPVHYNKKYFVFLIAEGRRHDSGMLADSGLLPILVQNALSLAGLPMCVYGDPAYPLRVQLQAPFRNGVNMTQQMAAYNKSMSEVRISVE